MTKITAKTARIRLVKCLQAFEYVPEKYDVIDIYFRRGDRIAVAQVRTHLGITRLGLTFGLDHELTTKLIAGVQPYFRIWNVRGLPFFQCPIVEPYAINEFEGNIPVGGIDAYYYAGLGTPRIPSASPSNLAMILPPDRDSAYSKIETATSFERMVFSEILPKIDAMLPCLEPAWFLCNTTPAGDAIVMLARAIELGHGRRQFEYFQEYMLLKHGPLGEGLGSAGWQNSLPTIERIINEWEGARTKTRS